ncbi:MAG: hypothetical protein LBD24_04895 [Spirochaetaceae bacterium]|nr:hypothetical protein [Spirochaetaceae bacterium]
MHYFETTSGPAVPPAAGGVLHQFETTGGHAETAGGCGRRLWNRRRRCGMLEVWIPKESYTAWGSGQGTRNS